MTGLATITGADAEAALADALRSEMPEVRGAAAAALASRGTPASRSSRAFANDADPIVAALGSEAAIETEGGGATHLQEMWRARPDQHEAIVPLMASLSDADALPLLTAALRDAKDTVAQAAAAQLAAIEDPEAERALLALVDDPSASRALVASVATMLLASGSDVVRARSADLTRAGGTVDGPATAQAAGEEDEEKAE